jgi:hypothetical protein
MAVSYLTKTKEILSENGDSFKLSRTLDTVEQNFHEGQMGTSIGQCKNLIEGLAKTVLDKKSVPYENGISFPKLVKKAVTELNIGQVGNNDQKTNEAFLGLVNSICNSIDNTAKSIAALRNDYSPEAHGRSADHTDLPKEYAEFIILQTDALLCFLLNIVQRHKEYDPPLVFTDHEDYNDGLYEQFGEIEIFGDLYQAPEILFQQHPKKYKEKLQEFKLQDGQNHDE